MMTRSANYLHACLLHACASVLWLSLLAGCATRGVAPGPAMANTPLATQAAPDATAFDHALVIFAKDLRASFENTIPGKNVATAQKAFRSGLTVLELQCSRYIDALGSANQAATNERRQVDLVGGVSAALMGLTGSSAKAISGVATAFSFSGASMDVYTNSFLFSDAASSVTKIVGEARKAWLDETVTDSNLANMQSEDAVRLLDEYEQICRPAQIRALIDQSVARGQVVAQRAGASDADVGPVLQALQAAFGPSFTEAQAITLYAWLRHPDQRNAGAHLSTLDPVAGLLPADADGAATFARKLSQAFLPVLLVGSRVPERWRDSVDLLLQPPQKSQDGPAPAASMGAGPPRAPATQPAPVTARPRSPLLLVR